MADKEPQLSTTLEMVATIYADLRENLNLRLFGRKTPVGEELSIARLCLEIAEYRSDLEYRLKIYDFRKNADNDPVYQTLFPNGEGSTRSPIRSFNKIFERKEGSSGKRFLSEIHLDSNSSNYCWARFATVKEACHILFVLEHEQQMARYPYTHTDSEVQHLLTATNRLPFSILDFSNEDYEKELKIENASEILAYLLLTGHDDVKIWREEYFALEPAKRDWFDFYPNADGKKVPRRYTELFTSDEKVIEPLLLRIQRALDPSPFDTVPDPFGSGE